MDFILTIAVDLLFLIIMVICVLTAMHKGFFKSALSLVCIALALIIAGIANEPVAEWCYDSFISDSVVEKVEAVIPDAVNNINPDEDIRSFFDSLPEFVTDQLEKMNINVDESLEKIGDEELSSAAIAEKISNELIRPGVVALLRLICFIVIFLVLRLLFGIIAKFVSKFADLPVFKKINKSLGAVLGLLQGVFCIYSVF